MNKKINSLFSQIWIFAGPCFLLLAYFLLIYHAAPLLERPVWLTGLTLCVALALAILYLSLTELKRQNEELQKQIDKKEEEAIGLHSILEEAQNLHRNKIDRFEEMIASQEKEQKEMQAHCEKIEEETKAYKHQALAFQTSLEDALDELRAAQEKMFLLQEGSHLIPKDLPQQHKQLREQFEEKTLVLDQTRRRLFMIEGQLLLLKKQQESDQLNLNENEIELWKILYQLFEENVRLDQEVSALEKLIFVQGKTSEKRSKKKFDRMLEFQFESSSQATSE